MRTDPRRWAQEWALGVPKVVVMIRKGSVNHQMMPPEIAECHLSPQAGVWMPFSYLLRMGWLLASRRLNLARRLKNLDRDRRKSDRQSRLVKIDEVLSTC